MSGYFLHTKVLKLIFLFSLDTFISFNEDLLTFFLFAFCSKYKKRKKERKPRSRKGMSRRHRASCSSVLPLQESWCSGGRPKPCGYHKLAVLLKEKHNLMGAQFPNLQIKLE